MTVFVMVQLRKTHEDMCGLLSLSYQGCLFAQQHHCPHLTHHEVSVPSYSFSPLYMFGTWTGSHNVAGAVVDNMHIYACQGLTEMGDYSSVKLFNDLCQPLFTVILCSLR